MALFDTDQTSVGLRRDNGRRLRTTFDFPMDDCFLQPEGQVTHPGEIQAVGRKLLGTHGRF